MSVMRIGDPLCPISLPLGGVKHCPGVLMFADVWCYKGKESFAIIVNEIRSVTFKFQINVDRGIKI